MSNAGVEAEEGFTKEELLIAIRRVVESNVGYYSYKKLSEELGGNDSSIGRKKISALIEKNVLHYRPPSPMARDFFLNLKVLLLV